MCLGGSQSFLHCSAPTATLTTPLFWDSHWGMMTGAGVKSWEFGCKLFCCCSLVVIIFLNCGKMYITKWTILTIFPCCDIKYIPTVGKSSPPSISITLSSSPKETLCPLNTKSPSPAPPAPGNHHSTSRFYEFDHPRCLISGALCRICPFVFGLCHGA